MLKSESRKSFVNERLDNIVNERLGLTDDTVNERRGEVDVDDDDGDGDRNRDDECVELDALRGKIDCERLGARAARVSVTELLSTRVSES